MAYISMLGTEKIMRFCKLKTFRWQKELCFLYLHYSIKRRVKRWNIVRQMEHFNSFSQDVESKLFLLEDSLKRIGFFQKFVIL